MFISRAKNLYWIDAHRNPRKTGSLQSFLPWFYSVPLSPPVDGDKERAKQKWSLRSSSPSIKGWKWKSLSLVWLVTPWNSPGQNIEVGSLSLLQGIFPNQKSNPGLLHCRWILYQLSHQGSPIILEWVAYPFSRGSSQLQNWTGVSCIAGGFFTNWAIREAPLGLRDKRPITGFPWWLKQ